MKCTRRILSYCCKNNSNLEEFGTIGGFLSRFPLQQKEGSPPTFLFFFPVFYFSLRKIQYWIVACCAPGSPWRPSVRCERGSGPRGAPRCLRAPSAFGKVRASGGEGRARSGARRRFCPCPSVCLPPRPKVRAAGCFPPDGIPPSALLRDRATQALPLSPPLQKSNVPPLAQRGEEAESAKFLLLTLLSLACIAGVLAASGVVYCLRHRAHHRLKEKLSALGADAGSDAPAAYQVRTELSSPPPALPRGPPGGPSRLGTRGGGFVSDPSPPPPFHS